MNVKPFCDTSNVPPRSSLPTGSIPVVLVQDLRNNVYFVVADASDVDSLVTSGVFADLAILVPAKLGSRGAWLTTGGIKRALAAVRRRDPFGHHDFPALQKSSFSIADVLPIVITPSGKILTSAVGSDPGYVVSLIPALLKYSLRVWRDIFSHHNRLQHGKS